MGRHRLRLMLLVAIGVVVAIAGSGQAVGISGPMPEEFRVAVGFGPKALSKTKPTPAFLTTEVEVGSPAGTHPLALSELLIEVDRNIGINVEGLPTCHFSVDGPSDPATACRDALVGRGNAKFRIVFADGPEITIASRLFVFNGGSRDGVTNLLISAYITVPVPTLIVTKITFQRLRKGRYGLLATAKIPKIVGGAGSVTSFNFKVDRKFTYKRKQFSVVTGKCPDRKLEAHTTGILVDGSRYIGQSVRPCAGKS